jgi:tetratricopeptide (TPR) repeat protein
MKFKLLVLSLLLLSASLFSSNYSESFKIAEKMYNDGLYDESISEFSKVVQNAPTSFEAEKSIIYIGQSYENEGKYLKAIKYYQQLLDGYPSSLLRDKAIYKLINIYYQREDFSKVIKLSRNLFKSYPKTKYAEKSIIAYLNSLYKTKDFNDAIVASTKMIKNYPNSKYLPEIYFIQAKVFDSNSMPDEYIKNINIILKKYKSSGIYWDAKLYVIKKFKDNRKIIKELSDLLNNKVSRNYEEKIKFELFHYLFLENDYVRSLKIISDIISKFSNSIRLPEAIYYKTLILIHLNRFSEIINNYQNNEKVFKRSEWKSNYYLLVSEAFFKANNMELARRIIDELPILSDSLEYKKEILRADILRKEGFYHKAISILSVTGRKFSHLNVGDELNYKIGEIFFTNLKDYDSAIRYYKLVVGNPNRFLEKISKYKIAICLESAGNVEEAIKVLYKIDADNYPDLKNKIEKKRDYLNNFVRKNTNKAVTDLIHSFASYINDADKQKAKLNLSDILYYDLKDFDSAAEILDSPEAYFQYKKAYILLKKLKKDYDEQEINAELKDKIIAILDNLKTINSLTFADDIQLRLEILEKNGKVDKNTVEKMEILSSKKDLINNNYYHRILSKYYESTKNTDKIIYHLNLIEKNKNISLYEYFEYKSKLADMYFSQKKYDLAAKTYEIAESVKPINSVQRKYNFAFSLDKIGKSDLAIKEYQKIIKNYPDFEKINEILFDLSDWYAKSKNFVKSNEFLLKISPEKKDDSYWKKLASNYRNMQNLENEKNALMHIVKKSIPTLKRLAEVQFETKDLTFATYSYSQLLKKSKDKKFKINIYADLGHIYFLQKEYEKSIKNYLKTIFPKKKTTIRANSIPNFIIIKELVISYYKVGNRPKAETYEKKYKKLLKQNPIAKSEILLNRGIYYQKYNLKKSKKIFDSIVKNKKISSEIKDQARFWRGVTLINQKKSDKAIVEFNAVLNSKNKELVNQAQLKLGILYFSKEKYQEALDHYSYVIQNDSTGTLALEATKNYAIVCKTIEEWGKAIDAYELIISRWGDDRVKAKTRFDIAFCYYRDKKYPKAIEMFEKAIANLKDNALKAEAQYWIGESYFHNEKYEEAVSSFLKVSYQYPDQIKWKKISDLRAAESYYQKGDYQKAKYMFKKVIKKYGPGSDVGKEASKRLKELEN